MTEKKVFSASDAAPVVLYAKRDGNSQLAHPIIGDTSGYLITSPSSGMIIPRHDEQVIDESAAPALTTITYKLSNVTVATKTIAVSGTTTTITLS